MAVEDARHRRRARVIRRPEGKRIRTISTVHSRFSPRIPERSARRAAEWRRRRGREPSYECSSAATAPTTRVLRRVHTRATSAAYTGMMRQRARLHQEILQEIRNAEGRHEGVCRIGQAEYRAKNRWRMRPVRRLQKSEATSAERTIHGLYDSRKDAQDAKNICVFAVET